MSDLISRADAIEAVCDGCVWYKTASCEEGKEEWECSEVTKIRHLPSADAELYVPRGTYQCFHCGSYSVIWGADFDFEDYGLEGKGIVHSCHCANCGADIEYYVRVDDDEERTQPTAEADSGEERP